MSTMKKSELYNTLNEMANRALAYFCAINDDPTVSIDEKKTAVWQETLVTGVILGLKYTVEDNYSDDKLFSEDDVNELIDFAAMQRKTLINEEPIKRECAENTFNYVRDKIKDVFEQAATLEANTTTNVHKMLESEITKWVNKYDVPQTSKKAAVKELLSAYEGIQEWNEDIMTTGASVDEINDWLRNSEDAEYIIDQTWERASSLSKVIMHGLGFEMNAITDVFEVCFATIEGVKEYAEKHGYDEDAEVLDMDRDGFIDAVRETFMEELAAQGERLEIEDGLTDSVIIACFDRTSSLLEDTKVCQDLGVTFEGQANSYASNWLMECDEGTYSEFENEIGEIFDRLAAEKQTTKSKPAVERD